MSGFTSQGFTKKTLEEIRAEIIEELLAKVDAALDLSETQPEGQMVAIFAQREAVLWELLEVVAKAIDPNAAEDWLLDAICAMTGTVREAAKKSTVWLDCVVDDAFSATAGQMMANVSGQENVRFTNKSAVGPLAAGTHSIEFQSVEYGPIVANATTLTVITAPVSGWTSCSNPLDAELGALREEDTPLRVRREEETTAPGACTPDATRADVLRVKGVQQCFVFENVTLETDAEGLPGKAFEVVVYDGETPEATNLDVATAVWKSKPSGGEMYGSITTNVVDEMGVTRAVKWSRATVKNVYLNFENVVIDPENFPANGVTLIKDACAAKAAKIQNLGIDVVALKMRSAAESVPGVIDVPTLKLGLSASPSGTANITITGREIASVDTSRITVSTVTGTP